MEEGDSEKQHNSLSERDTPAVPAESLPHSSIPEREGTSTGAPAPSLLVPIAPFQADAESNRPGGEKGSSETTIEKTVQAQESQAEDVTEAIAPKPLKAPANLPSKTSLKHVGFGGRPVEDSPCINAPIAPAATGAAEAGNLPGSYEEERGNEDFQHQIPASNNDDNLGEDAAVGKQPSENEPASSAEMHQEVRGNELQDELASSPATEPQVTGLALPSALAPEAGRNTPEAAADDPWVITEDPQESGFDGSAAATSETPPAHWLASRTAGSLLAMATEHAAAAARQSFRLPLERKADARTPASDDEDYPGFNCNSLAAEKLPKPPLTPPKKLTTEEPTSVEYEKAPLKSADEEDAEALPAFADDENVALHNEITSKLRLLTQQGIELGQKTDRVQLMQQHLRQLHAETTHLESLANAKEAHIHSDQHMDEVTLSQTSKLKAQVQQQQQYQQELQNRLTALQLEVARGQEQIDCFKLRMKWNEDELAQWRSAANQNEVRSTF